jgi:hypothetical protein
MEGRMALIYALLASPGLDPDEVRLGQLLTLLAALLLLLFASWLTWMVPFAF